MNVNSKEALEVLINNNQMVLVYFGSNTCNVCNAIESKVQELLKNYPKIKSSKIDVEKYLEISAAYNVFTIPVILVFIEGKEMLREARYISIQDVKNKLERYYNVLFE
ncbi:thioredoxin family protein [Clostridium sp. SYSU_GA19001]|uniref:thioredoxin family protein n=1 Tax=Clostridium caldaquaticum TaxID=2940653 RepID=UPI002077397B|nr:thioredoxin family protein [Clostridium caldaquaticum]MCM8712000.1 thioredoxin family protein [Clostridium caldaquaticum]